MNMAEMTEKMASAPGFIAALDQSGGSTPKALEEYGLAASEWSSDEQMFGLIQAMRVRIITSPSFASDRVIGAILFERTMDGDAKGSPVPQALHERGIVPFLKIDRGLEEERNGVRLMKQIPDLEPLLARAVGKDVFGTKERSVINLADPVGIAAIVEQQFEVARTVLAAGLVPIIEPEVNIASTQRAEADALLLDGLLRALSALPDEQSVMVKLSLPAEPGLFQPLVDHPRVLRVVALSGGLARREACVELAKNPGVIASFSRALLQDLRHGMTDAEFDKALCEASDEIYQASTMKD